MATAYQLLRFTLLFFSVMLALQETSAAGAISLVLAIGAPALVVVLLLIQLGVTGNAMILWALRLVGVIHVLTAVTLFFNSLRDTMPLISATPLLILLGAFVMIIADFAFLVFLLIYSKRMEET